MTLDDFYTLYDQIMILTIHKFTNSLKTKACKLIESYNDTHGVYFGASYYVNNEFRGCSSWSAIITLLNCINPDISGLYDNLLKYVQKKKVWNDITIVSILKNNIGILHPVHTYNNGALSSY
jgi:hypothetical protein